MADKSDMSTDTTDTAEIVNTWASIEEAAIILGVSARTISRRVRAGQLESRVADDGGREVLISQPIDMSDTCPPTDDSHTSDIQIRPPAGVANLSVILEPLVHAATHVIARQAADAARSRRSSRFAWAVVVMMTLVTGAAIIGGLRAVDRAQAAADVLRGQVRQLDSQLAAAASASDKAVGEHERLTTILQLVRQDRAHAQGMADAQAQTVSAILAKLPTSRPTTQPAALADLADAGR